MNNPLLRSVAVVVLTWWAILTIYGEAVHDMGTTAWKILVVTGAAISSFAVVYFALYLGRTLASHNLSGISSRGLSVSLGGIPTGLGEPKRLRGASLVPGDSRLYRWLRYATDAYPRHAELFEACIQVYAHNKHLPASPIPGGHGGLTLLEHALHVAEVTMEMAETWVYDGSRDKKGRLRVPLIDPEYEFNRNDPLIPVLAIAHDIGKIECYAHTDDGGIVEYRQDHDTVSGLILARMPETWKLPAEDRKALFYAVSHYHHPSDLPRHVDDRTRAIMELLIAADVEASTREGDPDRAKAWKKLAEEPGEDEMLWEAFRDLMAVPYSINGSDKARRLGYKFGDFIYLSEERVRYALAEALNTPSAADARSRLGDGRYKISERLMKAMLDRGLLYHVHEGKEYGVARALFRVQFVDPRNPDYQVEMPAVIIMKLCNEFEHLKALSDSRLAPGKVTPLYSERSARNKGFSSSPIPAAGASPSQDRDGQDGQAKPAASSGIDTSHARRAPDAKDGIGHAPQAAPDVACNDQRTKTAITTQSQEAPGTNTKPLSPLELLQKLREEHELAMRKRTKAKGDTETTSGTVQALDVQEHILNVSRNILSLGADGGVRYHVDDRKKLTYILITDGIAKQIGEAGVEWLRRSENKRLRIRAGDVAEYLVVGEEYLYKDDQS